MLRRPSHNRRHQGNRCQSQKRSNRDPSLRGELSRGSTPPKRTRITRTGTTVAIPFTHRSSPAAIVPPTIPAEDSASLTTRPASSGHARRRWPSKTWGITRPTVTTPSTVNVKPKTPGQTRDAGKRNPGPTHTDPRPRPQPGQRQNPRQSPPSDRRKPSSVAPT